jgi:hypothetical protein
MYRNGYFILAFDLTTAQDGGMDAYSIPSVVAGKLYFKMSSILIACCSEYCYAAIKTKRRSNSFKKE